MSELLGRLAAGLPSRYAVEREIARGGMAVVYLAQDTKHDRRVALKVLLPDVGASLGHARFLREIRVAARLSHPHILSVHDSGEADGLLFYTMPYVEGETLRDRLKREHQLAIDEVIVIAQQVASALDYAHRHGIIHRDVKPENILLQEREALVADFGVARALDAAAGDQLTQTGLAVGTPVYMSPEQAAGDRELDGRTDVYSLGCVVYEMLAGEPPFSGGSANAILARQAVGAVLPLRALRHDLPEAVERAVLRALAKSPSDRFRTTLEFTKALDDAHRRPSRKRRALMLLSVFMGAVAGVGAAAWWFTRFATHSSTPTSVAVLPCSSAVDNPAKVYLGDLMTEDLIAEISKSRLFEKVIASSSIARYRGTAKSPEQIGNELGVEALLYCAYQQHRPTERVRVQLVRARDGALLWTDDFGRDEAGVGPELPMLVASGLAVSQGHAGPSGSSVAKQATTDIRALGLYKEGRYYLSQVREDALRRSIVLFRESIARDSSFALPYVGLARAYFLLGIAHGSLDEREAFPLLKEAAEHALSLDETISEGHELLGVYELYFGWNWEVARWHFFRAIELDPASATAHENLAFYYSYVGRPKEALTESARSVELSPVDPLVWGDAGVQFLLARRYDDALRVLRRGLELAPKSHPDHWAIGAVYAEMGDMRQALEHLRAADSLSGHEVGFRGYLGYGEAIAGDTAAAHKILAELERQAESANPSGKTSAAIALVQIGIGQRDSAFKWLDRAYEQRGSLLVFDLLAPPGWRLAGDPRYASMLRRVGIAWPRVASSARSRQQSTTEYLAVPRRSVKTVGICNAVFGGV